MKLHSSRNSCAQALWAGERVCLHKRRHLSWFPRFLVVFLLLGSHSVVSSLVAQQKRMIIDGAIRVEGRTLPANTKIRILHQDSSIARTISLYDPRNLKFGVRLSSQDDFADDERILFRVVISAQDSFLARSVGPPLQYKATAMTGTMPTEYILLFRNTLPTIYRQLPDTTINENQLLRYRIVAVDRDADTVRFGLRNAPMGARVDPITGMFSWRPTFDQAGRYRMTLLISDGYDTDSSRTSTIVVNNVNRPPRFVVVPSDTTIHEADSLRISLLAVDPDGDEVSYRQLQVPDGMSVDSSSGAIRWCPTYDQAGQYALRFIATDGSAFDTSRTVRMTVLNVNRPPIFEGAMRDTLISENDTLSYTFFAKDPDGDTLQYSLVKGPPGAEISPSGGFAWRPNFSQAGTYDFSVGASDHDTTTECAVRIRVLNTDRPPTPNFLYTPANRDTIRLALAKPVLFSWTRSFDPDSEDVLRYRLHIWGPQLDTSVSAQTDSLLSIGLKPHLVPLSVYHWYVVVNDGSVNVSSADTFSFRTSAGIVGSVELLSQIPRTYYLEQSLPDPFNPLTTIRYALPERSYVKLAIFNVLGEPLLVLVAGEKDAGVYDVTFDASELTSGAYTFRLDAHPLVGGQYKDFVNTKKMFIVR